jgi:hypothetical protein
MSIPTVRDEELGAALRALETPEHRPGFESELRRRLAEVDRQHTVLSLPEKRRSRRRVLVGAAAAVAAALAIALPLSDRIPRLGGAEVASAAQVQAQVRESLASLESLGGVLVSRCTTAGCADKSGEARWTFLLTSRGDLRLAGPHAGEIVTYDADRGIVRTAQRSASVGGATLFYAERDGVAPGPPDVGLPTWVLPDEFGAYVRALLAARDPRVREVSYAGRPAWSLEVDAVPNAIVPEYTGDRFEITVDRETGIPVHVVERKGATVLRELSVERLAVDEPVRGDAFALAFPPGVEVSRSDDGFRRVPLSSVGGSVGYVPLVPGWVPDGFELAEVAVAQDAGPTGPEAGNPLSRRVVSLSYRRGFEQLVVTSRLAGDGTWDDPVATGEGYLDHPELVTIRDGALAGARGSVVLEPRGVPHVWAVADGLVVTVSGSLSRDELVRVAGSLERR